MKKSVKPQLPKGFTPIRGGGDFPPSWDYDAAPQLIGVMRGMREVEMPKRGKMPARTCKVFEIEAADGKYSVWESAGLRALGTVKKGRTVCIQYLGQKKIKGQANPMRDFAVGIK